MPKGLTLQAAEACWRVQETKARLFGMAQEGFWSKAGASAQPGICCILIGSFAASKGISAGQGGFNPFWTHSNSRSPYRSPAGRSHLRPGKRHPILKHCLIPTGPRVEGELVACIAALSAGRLFTTEGCSLHSTGWKAAVWIGGIFRIFS